MTALQKIDEVTAQIEDETIALQLHLATRMMQRTLLELRYAGQPRLPQGESGGGQYTFGPAGTTNGLVRRGAQGLGRQTFSGYLIRQERAGPQGPLLCTYYDSRSDNQFTKLYYTDKCPDIFIRY